MDKGERAIRFIENLMLPEGTPFHLQEWERDYVRKLFGTLTPESLRQYRDSLLMLPKKNGKSTLLAGIALYCLFNEAPGSEIYSAANSRDQASIVFNTAKKMILADRHLRRIVLIRDSRKQIDYPARGNFFRALSAEAGDKAGLNVAVVIIDEMCDMTDSELFDQLITAQAAQPQPLTMIITTAGWDRQGVLYRIYQRAKAILAGSLEDPTFFPVIYEADPKDDWTDLATWRKANPNFGVTVKPAHAEKMIREAKDLPATLNRLLRWHLNIWTESDVSWLPRDKWEFCGGIQFDPETLKGKPCYVALDLSSTGDITAAALVFPLSGAGPRWAALMRFYCPSESIHRRSVRDRVPYDTWSRQGHLITTPGNIVDYDYIRADLQDLRTQYDIREIAYDRWNATQLTNQLAGDGFTMVPFGQGFGSMAAPCRALEAAVVGGTIAHGSNPILDWMAGNVVAHIDAAGNIKPDKARSREKIDGIVAILMGMGRAIAQPVVEEYTGPLVI